MVLVWWGTHKNPYLIFYNILFKINQCSSPAGVSPLLRDAAVVCWVVGMKLSWLPILHASQLSMLVDLWFHLGVSLCVKCVRRDCEVGVFGLLCLCFLHCKLPCSGDVGALFARSPKPEGTSGGIRPCATSLEEVATRQRPPKVPFGFEDETCTREPEPEATSAGFCDRQTFLWEVWTPSKPPKVASGSDCSVCTCAGCVLKMRSWMGAPCCFEP